MNWRMISRRGKQNLLAIILMLHSCNSAFAIGFFAINSEHLTDERIREFSTGVCNASLPLNDHLYQLISWCRQKNMGPTCFGHGPVSCLFKKYIDTLRRASSEPGDGFLVTSEDLEKRILIFRENLLAVEYEIGSRLLGSKVAASGSARFGITKFMHLSRQEFRERYLSSLTKSNATRSLQSASSLDAPISLSDLQHEHGISAFAARPDRVDWRDTGFVTDVKNQLSCGACWAFAMAEVAETQYAQKYGVRTELSVQQVTDCTTCSICGGCRGGDIFLAAQFYSVSSGRAICEDKFYTFTGKDETCRQVTSGLQVQTAGVRSDNFVNREDGILDYLWLSGTVAAAVDAHLWQFYLDGTIMHNCETELNHAVQVVGYDLTSDLVPFYLVRNSWGADWGMAGYLQIAQGSNVCGLAQGVVTFTAA